MTMKLQHFRGLTHRIERYFLLAIYPISRLLGEVTCVEHFALVLFVEESEK